MDKKEINAFRDAVLVMRDFFKYRRAGLEIPAAVHDTIQALYKSDDLKPMIMKRQPIEGGWWFLIHLPPGTDYLKFKGYERLFAESFGGTVFISRNGKAVHLKAYGSELQKSYPYIKHINPADFEKMYLPCHFGFSASGPVINDLDKLQCILIGGNRGGGKSNLIITLITCLLQYSTALVGVIDFKKVDTVIFKPYVAYADDIEPARRILHGINKEMDRREILFSSRKANKIEKMIKKGFDIPHIVLFIDELTEMQDEESIALLNRILRKGRALGVCVVCATQRPSSTAIKNWGDSKMLFPTRVCFSVPDVTNSQIILDNDRGAALPNDKPGRCIFQWDQSIETQTLKLEPEEAEEILQKANITREVIFANEELPKRLPPRQVNTGITRKLGRPKH